MDQNKHDQSTPPKAKPGEQLQPMATSAQEEWGERIDTSRNIARGGHDSGHVPGATGDEPGDPRSGQK